MTFHMLNHKFLQAWKIVFALTNVVHVGGLFEGQDKHMFVSLSNHGTTPDDYCWLLCLWMFILIESIHEVRTALASVYADPHLKS